MFKIRTYNAISDIIYNTLKTMSIRFPTALKTMMVFWFDPQNWRMWNFLRS